MATGATDTPGRDLRLAALVAGSRRLIGVLEHLYRLGSSHHGSLYDRQNLGAATDRIALGPPQHNAPLFRSRLAAHGLETFSSEAAVVPVRVADRLATLAIAHALLERGVYVNPILSPGVPVGSERLRCSVTTAHSEADLLHAADTIADVVRGQSQASAVAAR